ncbi:MAG: hypothetical protein WA823_13390 [Candidatus Acidiferrales bacterium]
MMLLEIEPLDLGEDVRAIGLELTEADEYREPIRGAEATKVWVRALPAIAGTESWSLDFFSHIDRVRDFCDSHQIAYRASGQRVIVIQWPGAAHLESLLQRFQNETFGLRAGALAQSEDATVEAELARRGVDAYHSAFKNYVYCGACDFENGSVVLFTEKLTASEVIRRVRPVLDAKEIEIRLPA